ncbi:MAG TPA: integrase core domain-containing protein [Terriglobales bacterium]|nr:integrase core domain-containing protein [Terriglobales bacterium]
MVSRSRKTATVCLNEHWFVDLAHARQEIEGWRCNYNQVRPHSALGYLTDWRLD